MPVAGVPWAGLGRAGAFIIHSFIRSGFLVFKSHIIILASILQCDFYKFSLARTQHPSIFNSDLYLYLPVIRLTIPVAYTCNPPLSLVTYRVKRGEETIGVANRASKSFLHVTKK